MPDRKYSTSPLGKAYTKAEEDGKYDDERFPVTLPNPGTAITIMASDIPVGFSFSDLEKQGYNFSEPFVVNAAEGQWGYTVSSPIKTVPNRLNTDIAERNAFIKLLKDKGFDPAKFSKAVKFNASKLKPGEKTNWKPGRLPNGGRISADGTYIPGDVVKEDERRAKTPRKTKQRPVPQNVIPGNM